MSFRKMTSIAGFTVNITEIVDAKYAGLLQGVRGIKFGENRDGTPDIRYVGDFLAPNKKWTTRGDLEFPKDGLWSAWLPTQLRNILIDTETKQLLVDKDTPIVLTYTGAVPTKGGGNDTHIFDVEGGDVGDALPDLEPSLAEEAKEERAPVAAGRSNGRSRR